jgi:hypothetical protein
MNFEASGCCAQWPAFLVAAAMIVCVGYLILNAMFPKEKK